MAGESGLTLAGLEAVLAPHRLEVLGGFAVAEGEDGSPRHADAGPAGAGRAGFWPHLTAQEEWGGPDPVDRWSRRVIGRIACDLGAKALFPFGGPPYSPFQRWALRTGRAWESPVRLLVHDRQGLLVSFRGALALKERLELAPAAKPCDSCADKPCLAACPVGALSAGGYDVPACHASWTAPAKIVFPAAVWCGALARCPPAMQGCRNNPPIT